MPRVVRAPRGHLLVALALLGACRSTPASAPPASASVPVAPAAPFEPGSRYATTFEATDVGCRGSTTNAYEGQAVLAIAPDRRATFELTLVPKDVHGLAEPGLVVHSVPVAATPSSPTTCRWVGTGKPAPGRWVASLEADDHTRSAECGAAPPSLALDCAPVVMPVPDANGIEHDARLLRCSVATPVPSMLWVIGDADILLSEEALHLELETVPFGLSRQTRSLSPPSNPG